MKPGGGSGELKCSQTSRKVPGVWQCLKDYIHGYRQPQDRSARGELVRSPEECTEKAGDQRMLEIDDIWYMQFLEGIQACCWLRLWGGRDR